MSFLPEGIPLFSLVDLHYQKTIKKAEHWRTDAFELRCWRRPLSAPWTARRSNQSIWKEINTECSWEGLMLKLKLQYLGHLMRRRTDALEKNPDARKDWRQKEKRTAEMRWLDSIIGSVDMNLSKLQEIVKNKGAWNAAGHGVTKSRTRLRDWTATTKAKELYFIIMIIFFH